MTTNSKLHPAKRVNSLHSSLFRAILSFLIKLYNQDGEYLILYLLLWSKYLLLSVERECLKFFSLDNIWYITIYEWTPSSCSIPSTNRKYRHLCRYFGIKGIYAISMFTFGINLLCFGVYLLSCCWRIEGRRLTTWVGRREKGRAVK